MTDTQVISLTDDELVAISAMTDQRPAWPLTTVDLSSAIDVERSILRGGRSLAVRGLAGDDSMDLSALRPAMSVVCRTPELVAAYVDDDMTLVAASDFILVHAAGDEATLVWSQPLGLHTYVGTSRAEVLMALAAELEELAPESRMAVWVTSQRADGLRGWVVSSSGTSELRDSSGGYARWEAVESAGLDQTALAWSRRLESLLP